MEPFIDDMPPGVTILTPGRNNGTCDVVVTPNTITLPASRRCPRAAAPSSRRHFANAGTVANTTGTLLTEYPMTAFPMRLVYGGNTIWAANFYLTMMGVPDAYSVGPCQPTETASGRACRTSCRGTR